MDGSIVAHMTRTPCRIVSLVPSLTETLFDLGLDSEVVGVTRFCTEPAAQLTGKLRVGGTKNPDREKLARLAPDLLLVNTEENRREDIAWLRERFPVLQYFPRTVQDAADMVLDLGRAIGRPQEGEALKLLIEAEAVRVEAELFGERRLRVFYPIWKDPWMTINGDTYVHDMLRACGADNVFSGTAQRYPEIQLERLPDARPDLVLLPSEPYAFSEQHRNRLVHHPSVCGRPTLLVDGKAFSWHGSRTARGLRAVHEILKKVRQSVARE
jgi:ABC-type Fe3+-hydroxamate transport system substrate-binding protein